MTPLSLVSPRRRNCLLAGVLLGIALWPAAAFESVTNRVFPVGPGGQLVLKLDQGSIDVTAADTNAVVVTLIREVKGADADRAEALLARHALTFEQDGNTIRVQSQTPRDKSWGLGRNRLSIRCQVTVPRQLNLDFQTAGGSIRVPDLTGTVALQTAGGSLSMERITGSVTATTSGGSISIAGASGPVEATTSGGSIRLGEMGGSVRAETSGGSIRIASASGEVHADTSGGSIDLGPMSGPVQAGTSGGSISAQFPDKLGGDVSLETSGGGISVALGDAVNAELDAECAGGGVSSEITVTGGSGKKSSSLRGTIGSGGPRMSLQTSGGGIRVKRLVASR